MLLLSPNIQPYASHDTDKCIPDKSIDPITSSRGVALPHKEPQSKLNSRLNSSPNLYVWLPPSSQPKSDFPSQNFVMPDNLSKQ
jgi:hypothetical protein